MAEARFDPRVSAELVGATREGMLAGAFELQGALKQKLSEPGSGVQYAKRPTRSSAPGEPPAAQTGTLRRSVQVDDSAKDAVRIGTNLAYGRHTEFGTKRMAARPWFRQTLAANLERIAAAVVRGVGKS